MSSVQSIKNHIIVLEKSKLFCFFILFPFFEPAYFQNIEITHYLYFLWRVVSCFLILLYFCKKGNIGILRTVMPLILFYLIQSISTLFNGGGILTELRADLFLILPCLFVACFIQDDFKQSLDSLCLLMLIQAYAQAISVILFPKGLFLDTYYGRFAYWFWSNSGHISSLLLSLLSLLSVYCYLYNDKIIYKASLYIITVVYVIQIGIKFNDIGNLLGLAVVLAGVWLPRIINRIKVINGMTIYVVILAANIGLLFFNIQNNFGNIITQIFKKDMTLSSRTYIWMSAMKNVAESPILGKGNPSSFGEIGWNYYGGELFVAHNQLLDITVNGGILALVVYLVYLFFVYVGTDKISDSILRIYLLMGITGIGVIMLADSVTPFLPIYIMYTYALSFESINEISNEYYMIYDMAQLDVNMRNL